MHYFLKMRSKGNRDRIATYHVSAEDARFMYREFAKYPEHCKNMPEGGPEEAWTNGTELSSAKTHRTTILWGHRFTTDKEIFKQILEGKIARWED